MTTPTSSFAALKSSRNKSLEVARQQAEKLKTTFEVDERYWQPTVDKAGNGTALIRFLSPAKGEDTPWVRLWSHGFDGPGGWYIENSLTTLNKKDPVSEFNTKLWNKNKDKDCPFKKQATKQKRKLNYIANILVIKDPANPENNGKVFLYKFGQKIFEKIEAAMAGKDDGIEKIEGYDPFSMWDGANFKLSIRKKDNYRNYDDSTFQTPGPISDNDEELEAIWAKQYSLQAEVAPAKFKTYDELKARLDLVLGSENATSETSGGARSETTRKAVERTTSRDDEFTSTGGSDSPPWEEGAKSVEDSASGDDVAHFKKLLEG